MERKKALLLNSTTSLLQQVVALLCGLIVPKLIMSTYGSSVNGTIASVVQFISIASLIQGGVAGAARVAFYGPVSCQESEKTSEVYKTSQVFFRKFGLFLLAYVVILALIYPIVFSTPFSYSDCIFLVVIIGSSTMFEYLFGMTNQLLLFADQRSYINTLLQTICTIISALFSVWLIMIGASIIVVKFISALVLIIRPIFLVIYVHRHYSLDLSIPSNKKILSQSGAALAKSIAFFIHTSTDTLVITACLNVAWVSVYAVHRYVVGSISNLLASILGNTEAMFGQMIAKKETESIEKEVPIYDLLSKILSSIFFFTSIILISQFVDIYTKGISDINYNQPVFAILLCISEMIYCMSLTYNNMIMAAGHIKQTQWISITEALLNIVLSVIFVRLWGIIGVAIGTLIACIFNTIANIIYMRRYIFAMKLRYIIKGYFVNIGGGIITVFLFRYVIIYQANNFITFFVYAAIVFIVVAIVDFIANILAFRDEIYPLLNKLKDRLIKKHNI